MSDGPTHYFLVASVLAIALLTGISTDSAVAQQRDIGALNKQYDQLMAAGKYSEALSVAEKLEVLIKARSGANSAAYAAVLCFQASVHSVEGRYGKAEELFKRASTIMERPPG